VNVKELMNSLSTLPPDLEVWIIYDGKARILVGAAWVSQAGPVCLGGEWEPVFDDDDRPVGAPSEKVDDFWCPGKMKAADVLERWAGDKDSVE